MSKNYVWTNLGFIVEDDNLWFVPFWMNVLCEVNLSTMQIGKVKAFPHMFTEAGGIYNVRKYQEYIINVTAVDDVNYLYDIPADNMLAIPLKEDAYACEKFFNCTFWNNHAYFLPRDYNSILKLNMEDKTVTDISISEVGKMFLSCVQIEQNVYLVNQSESLIVFDMEEENFERIQISGSGELNTIVLVQEHELLMSNTNGVLYIYNLQNGTMTEIDIVKGTLFTGIAVVEDKLYLFPMYDEDNFTILNLKTLDTRKIHLQRKLEEAGYYDARYGVFSQPVVANDKVYVMNASHQCLYIIDTVTDEVCDVYIELNEMSEQQCDYFFNFLHKVGGVRESGAPYATLDYLLQRPVKKANDESRKTGKRIFESMKELL